MVPDSELDSILSLWEDHWLRGEDVPAEVLCRDHPNRLDEVRAQIRRLRAFDVLIGPPDDENPPVEVVEVQTRYRALRHHASGGLGDVLIARDEGLGREVALKLIKHPDDRDAERRGRFLREADITGHLEHPGIVPIYGVGQDERGRPGYAMRLIRGETLHAAIERFHRPEDDALAVDRHALRSLLGRLIAVCNAVAYAHDRGVIHRDLKPSNVMLGPFGETMVVDWGLAKRLGPRGDEAWPAGDNREGDLAWTRIGSAPGTPTFMSPEQASGLGDRLGPASDIYSLGAILYLILTGTTPFQARSADHLLEEVRRGEIEPPHRRKRGVPPALSAVCLKAMSRDPDRRYPTALALASDLEHWLADEPVSAYPDPILIRLGRWVRRHKPLVAGSGMALVVLSGALVVGTVVVGRQRTEAVVQRDRARVNLAQARQVVEEMYAEVAADLADRPGMDARRRTILTKALRFYEQFALLQSREPAVRYEAGRAAWRVGDIQSRLGNKVEAEVASRRALEILDPLSDEFPSNLDFARVRASATHDHAWALVSVGRIDRVDALLERGVEIRGRIWEDGPRTDDDGRFLIRDLCDLAIRYTHTGRMVEAEAPFRRAAALGEALAAERPSASLIRRELGWVYQSLGYHLTMRMRLVEAEAVLHRAVSTWEGLAGEGPEVPRVREGLGFALAELGNVLSSVDRMAEAEDFLRRSLAIRERLSRDNPDVFSYADMYSLNLALLGRTCFFNGRAAEAEDLIARSIEVRERLIREAPEQFFQICNLYLSYTSLGEILQESGRYREALDAFSRALNETKSLLKREPQYSGGGRMLCWSALGRAEAFASLGRPREALVELDAAAEHDVGSWSDQIHATRAALLQELGESGRAATEAASLGPAPSATALYQLARYQALASRGDEAIATLARAREAGLLRSPQRPRLLTDPSFDALRHRADFRSLARDASFPLDPFAY